MAVINVYEAKPSFSRLLARAEAGEVITLTRHGKPIAQLDPVNRGYRPVAFGTFARQVEISEDFDAWAPQDEADWFGE